MQGTDGCGGKDFEKKEGFKMGVVILEVILQLDHSSQSCHSAGTNQPKLTATNL